MKVYLLYCSCGYYEDYRKWVQGVYTTRELAENKKNKIISIHNQENEVLTREQYDEIEGFIDDYDGELINDDEAIVAKFFPDVNYADYQSFHRSILSSEDYHDPEIEEIELINE